MMESNPLEPKMRDNIMAKSQKQKPQKPDVMPLIHQSQIPQRTIRARHLAGLENITFTALSNDPPDPPANQSIIWQSNGVGSGDNGDIMMKITNSSGTTATTTLVDYSGL